MKIPMRCASVVFMLLIVGYGSCCVVQGYDTAIYLAGSGAQPMKSMITGNAIENESYYYAEGCLTYHGHYGNYLVLLCSDKFGDSVKIGFNGEGGNAVEALTLELGWLSGNDVIAGLRDEDIGKIGEVLRDNGGYVVYNNGWVSLQKNCDPDGKCYRCGPYVSAVSEEVIPKIGELVLPKAAAQMTTIGTAAPMTSAGAEAGAGAKSTGEKTGGIEPLLQYASVAIAAAVILGIVVFLLSRQRMADDIEVHKALSNETRIDILNELSDVQRIPTDISSRLGKSKATISEHLERLIEAGLIERVEIPGKKFVYYKITSKGKDALRRMAG